MTSHCGLVAILGAPNAGKSTLVNALVGQKIAIVSPKAQTTRTRLLGIAMEGETQIMLVDTPGIFAPERRLDRAMVQAAWGGAQDADLLALVIDAEKGIGRRTERILNGIVDRPERKILVLNKVDVTRKDALLDTAARINQGATFDETFFISATTGDGVAELKTYLAGQMPEGPWHFPADQVSDASERLTATEITREQLYLQLHAELPYASMVRTETYAERPDGSVEIHQQILVARPTQRAIVLGKGGSRIKVIGAAAREELTRIWGVPVHLYLHVKVQENWDDSRDAYREMGLDWVE
ncbi:GTPase Era [Sphingorhabdus soli]|uniref:GTPase Era n=1 Tax=Flavisphingopyxis soli TaxID=2601267 RepID=A0A5C6UBG4_9SPHN|nr:GTPase Era [Sphingorhabdus soli]TXC69128.1 GTPase Era [Sphingorhabdus soli]